MQNKKKSFLVKFIIFFITIAVLGGAFYYLYQKTNVLSEILGKKYNITFIVEDEKIDKKVLYNTIPEYDGVPTKKPTSTIEYVFDGWEPELKVVEEDATYTAKFKEQERLYNVSVVSNYENGGEYSGNGKIYPYLSDGSLSVTVNSGYIFEGWYINGVLKSTELIYSFEDIDEDFEIETRFSTIKKTITYNNLKEATNPNPIQYDITYGVIELQSIKTTGYRFVGWFTGENGTGEKVESIDSSLLENHVLYAHWSLEATLSLNVDGRDLTEITTFVGDVVTAETINLNFNPTSYGMSGYSVNKWYTDEALTNQYDFSNEVDDNFTLYGKFEYFMNEIKFYPYLAEFNAALVSEKLSIESFDELVAYIDYVRFYDISTQVKFTLKYISAVGEEITNEINKAYHTLTDETSFQTNSIFSLSGGFYEGSFYSSTSSWSDDATLSADPEKMYVYEQKDYAVQVENDNVRSEEFDNFNLNQVKNEITVSTSEQLVHVLQSGYKPKVVAGSNAEKVLNQAKEILIDIVNDEMTEFEKLRAIYEWIVLNVEYDNKALELSESLNTTQLKKYKAWYAEGVFDDGVAVCEGFAKAFLIMAKLENIPAIMVTGDGHAWNKVLYNGKWFGVDATHGSLSLNISGQGTVEVLTYTQFMFSDEFKSLNGYVADDYLEYDAEDSNVFNIYDYMDYEYNSNDFDLYINSTSELVLLFKYVDEYLTDENVDYAVFEIAIDSSFSLQSNLTIANMQAGTNVTILFDDFDSLNHKTYCLKITA